jgi:sugar phosphate permease
VIIASPSLRVPLYFLSGPCLSESRLNVISVPIPPLTHTHTPPPPPPAQHGDCDELAPWLAAVPQGGADMFQSLMFAIEFGGFVGGIAGGVVSDRVFRGDRIKPMVCASVLCGCLLASLTQLHAMGPVTLHLVAGSIAATAFVPHLLLGLAAREMVPEEVSNTAGGFVRSFGQLGGACAGFPFGWLLDNHGWGSALIVVVVCSAISAVALLPLVLRTARVKKD